ncbi:integrase [Photobacterium frigidiphilum]|uniref:Integrase n=1 Tax=Photobacterium frigidiphilum TaxID=264736 RepID=A0A2T3JAD6_9GAMM|nr:tyrosine-type recombinase/integrase [Photobacterium frigidiphilum]PSU45783.1 integrase [Photobacterium frigidiphilum]
MKNKDRYKEKLSQQANRFFHKHYYGLKTQKIKDSPLIHGRRTLREQIRIVGKAAYDMKVSRLKQITPEMAQTYLNNSRDKGLSHKYLSTIKCSLERLIFLNDSKNKLTPVIALPRKEVPLTDRNRAYTPSQIRLILDNLNDRGKLSVLIALNAGLRVEELLTIRRKDEATVSTSRMWSNKRFTGREDGVRYIVTGKNGLRREVMLDKHLAECMETKRLINPQAIIDRGEPFIIHYDLLGGKRFSEAFSKASYKALNWSHGAHGLRFTYAQNRIDNQLVNIQYNEAKLILSQELGHFREHITDRYIEPYRSKR